ncbi:hypothetical protein [Lentzea sp. NPDC051838]|uniref:hypothetical protein n=1 Tax=Lentzea sp. NPDC051838 TaxID=3154849 RepID=UPI00343A99AE
MTTNPPEVTFTSRKSAVAQRVIAGVSIVAVAAGAIALAFSGEPWWAIALWELGLLVTLMFLLAVFSSARSDADETAALVAAGTKVTGEVMDKTLYDTGDSIYYLLTVSVPLPDGGFEARHRCSQQECKDLEPGGRITVLVDPQTRAWAVLH